MNNRIFLSPPYMCGNEQKYVNEAFETNWIAPLGPNVSALEQTLAAYSGMPAALATGAGTAAIHLALRYFGVASGDYVFCSDFTFSGSCFPILYQNATPVFIDSEPESMNMSPVALEKAFIWAKEQNKLPKAVIIVDLYGQSADYDSLLPICKKYGVPVIEDSAEALGATYRGKKCGSFGDIGIYSFNGNKIVTSSGGGMALGDKPAIEKMLFWATQAREKAVHYEHLDYGYNYRMSNVCAGIGLGQLDGLEHKLKRRRVVYERYVKLFENTGTRVVGEAEGTESNHWLSLAILSDVNPHDVCAALDEENIEARPFWKPMHLQPVFKDAPYFAHGRDIGAELYEVGLCLPSGEALTVEQQEKIVGIVLNNYKWIRT